MYGLKSLADTVTLGRGMLAVLFIWIGANGGRENLHLAVLLLLVCWTGDCIDGGIARLSKHSRRTWIGDRDIEMDIFVSICLGIYLTLSGFVSLPWAVGYVALWFVIFWLSGRNFALQELVQAPIYATMIVTSLAYAMPSGLLLVGWILAVLLINRSRFTQRTVPDFLEGMRQALHGLQRR